MLAPLVLVLLGGLPHAACSPPTSASTLSASHAIEVDGHISSFMSLFHAEELNREWSNRLKVQRAVSTREFGELVYQSYELPWPLSPRELLMRCERDVDRRANKLVTSCESVDHPSAPRSEHAVRIELKHTQWVVTALPGERTRFELTIVLPASVAANVPAFVVRYCQRSMLRDSVTAFLDANKRLQLPADESFVGWQRTRSAAARARAQAASSRGSASHWEVPSLWALVLGLITACAVLQGAMQGGALGLVFATCRRRDRPLSMPSPQRSAGAVFSSRAQACAAGYGR